MRRYSPLLILFAVLLVYAPALWNGFVWDDTALILRDPLIRSPWLLAEGFRHFLFLDATASDFYRPLQRCLYTLDYTLAGFTPWVFHLTSLLAHAGAALALYAFGWRWLERSTPHGKPLAFAAALIWAVHPLHSSAVAYISGLADPLAALLGFGGLALLLARRWVAAGLCLGAAVFAKESGIVLLGIGLAFAWEILRADPAHRQQRLARFARVAIPALLLTGLYLGLRLSAEHTSPPAGKPVPAMERPALALRAVAEYGGLLAAPLTLRMERDVRTSRLGDFQTAAGALLLCGAGFWFRRADRTSRACLLAALAAYLPVSNLLALNATLAEHWLYIPSAFLFLAAAASAKHLRLPDRRTARFAVLATGICIAALGARTTWRCGDWRDQESFLRATIRDGGASSRMLGNLGALELSRGKIDEAVRDNRAALALRPDQPFAMLGLAQALIARGDFAEARQWLEHCEAIPLVRPATLAVRAGLEFQASGRDPLPLLREAAAVNPRFWPLRKRYIARLMERAEMESALRELRAVLADQPFRAETWEMLGAALAKIGQPERAQAAFAEADRRDLWRGKK